VAKKPPKSKSDDDPKLVFQYGELYRKACQALEVNTLILPSFVCAALSLELYFKALIIDAKREVPEKHDLQRLFSLLPEKSQNRIRDLFALTLTARKSRHQLMDQYFRRTTPLPTFDQALDWSKNAFVELRYAFQIVTGPQPRKPRHLWNAREIWDATRTLIFELHPNWVLPR
jgi:HEPN domain-containing protein